MAHFAIVSALACGLSVWTRLQDEGHEVRVYIYPIIGNDIGGGKVTETKIHVGEGIVPREYSWERLLAWAKEQSRSSTSDNG